MIIAFCFQLLLIVFVRVCRVLLPEDPIEQLQLLAVQVVDEVLRAQLLSAPRQADTVRLDCVELIEVGERDHNVASWSIAPALCPSSH